MNDGVSSNTMRYAECRPDAAHDDVEAAARSREIIQPHVFVGTCGSAYDDEGSGH